MQKINYCHVARIIIHYAYPIIINIKLAMVGIFDVSMSIFNSYIDAFSCPNYCHDGSPKVYYLSIPHSGAHGDMEYYLLTSRESAITYASTINGLSNIYQLRNNYSTWHHLNGSLYRSFSLLDGGLNFIIKFDLTSVFLWKLKYLYCKFSGYSTDLGSKTHGQASFSMEFESYSEAPKHIGCGCNRSFLILETFSS